MWTTELDEEAWKRKLIQIRKKKSEKSGTLQTLYSGHVIGIR